MTTIVVSDAERKRIEENYTRIEEIEREIIYSPGREDLAEELAERKATRRCVICGGEYFCKHLCRSCYMATHKCGSTAWLTRKNDPVEENAVSRVIQDVCGMSAREVEKIPFADKKNLVEYWMESLTESQKQIVSMRMYGMTFEKIAEMKNVSRQSVHGSYKFAIVHCRKRAVAQAIRQRHNEEVQHGKEE